MLPLVRHGKIFIKMYVWYLWSRHIITILELFAQMMRVIIFLHFRFVECKTQWTPSKRFTWKCCRHLTPDNEITSWSGGVPPIQTKNWYWEIPLLSFIAPPLRFHQIQEHIKNTYLLKKLLSRVTDNCMNNSHRLVRKHAWIADIICLKMQSFRENLQSAFKCVLIIRSHY